MTTIGGGNAASRWKLKLRLGEVHLGRRCRAGRAERSGLNPRNSNVADREGVDTGDREARRWAGN